MANNSPTPSSPTKIIRLAVLAALLSIVWLLYLLRRKPSPPTLQSPPINIDSVEAEHNPAIAKPTTLKKWHELAVLGLTLLYGLVLLILYNIDPRLSLGLIVATVTTAVGAIGLRRYLNLNRTSNTVFEFVTLPIRFYQSGQATSPEVALPRISRPLLLTELVILVVSTILITRPFYEAPANWQLSGGEVEWLTSTIQAAHTGLQEYGRIPRWQPYIGHGEPILENPFNFIFNPFAGAPSLILGPVMGLRVSVIIGFFLAGLGGWFLGRVLGFGTVARILLALILMGKGNIHTMLNSGYYQLALSQIYMPWVIGGVIAIARFQTRRWPIVLTALALTLQLFDGNLWYVLPTAVGAVCVATIYISDSGKNGVRASIFRHYMVTGVLTLGLSAVITLPIMLQYNRLGKHADEVAGGWTLPVTDVLPLYFDPDRDRPLSFFQPAYNRTLDDTVGNVDEFYYSFVIPGWYVLLIFVALPLYRPVNKRDRFTVAVTVLLFTLATLWGAGGKQPILWLYEHIALLRQWRFVPRALAVANFWLALWVAMRVNHVWKGVRHANWAKVLNVKTDALISRVIPVLLGLVIVVASGLAAFEVNDQWYRYPNILRAIDKRQDQCTTWLRKNFPDHQLDVWQRNYVDMTTFLNNRVRSSNISADFAMLPLEPTVGQDWLDLNALPPTFSQVAGDSQRETARQKGYQTLMQSPNAADGLPCLSRLSRPKLSYAYAISLTDLDAIQPSDDPGQLDLSAFSPIRLVERRDDQIALIVTGKRAEPIVVGVQENAYPGWQVQVDGQDAQIESVGKQSGVIIPAGEKPVQVYFVYVPSLTIIGGMITLVTAVICILILLIPRRDTVKETS